MPLLKRPFPSLFRRRRVKHLAELNDNEEALSVNLELNRLIGSVRKATERKVRYCATDCHLCQRA